MSWFPFFMELSGTRGLVAGGGTVALRKIRSLLPYGPQLTVIAPSIRRELQEYPDLKLLQREFLDTDLTTDYAFAIAASGSRQVNHRIAERCRNLRIPVNVADEPGECSFLFPALLKTGELSVGISTGGASPAAAVFVKEQLLRQLPEGFDEILAYLARRRGALKRTVPEQKAWSRTYGAMLAACLEHGRPLTAEEEQAVLEKIINEGRDAP